MPLGTWRRSSGGLTAFVRSTTRCDLTRHWDTVVPRNCIGPRGVACRGGCSKPEYPAHCIVRYVCNAGTFRFKNHQPFVSLTLAGEPIALEEVDGRSVVDLLL